jgi:hypothetical protein
MYNYRISHLPRFTIRPIYKSYHWITLRYNLKEIVRERVKEEFGKPIICNTLIGLIQFSAILIYVRLDVKIYQIQFYSDPSVVQLVASRYTACATPAPLEIRALEKNILA